MTVRIFWSRSVHRLKTLWRCMNLCEVLSVLMTTSTLLGMAIVRHSHIPQVNHWRLSNERFIATTISNVASF
jgi:hypothetical protein